MITTPEALKEEVNLQLGETVSRLLDFPIGYYKESKKVPMFGAQRKRASPRGGSPESSLSNALTGVAVAIRDVDY